MKKSLCVLITALLLISLAACATTQSEQSADSITSDQSLDESFGAEGTGSSDEAEISFDESEEDAYGLLYEEYQDLQTKGYTVIGLNKNNGAELVIPESHNGLPVVAIANGALEKCAWLKSISLPASLKRVGANAFPQTATEDVDGILYLDNWVVGCTLVWGIMAETPLLSNTKPVQDPVDGVIREGTVGVADGVFASKTMYRSIKLPSTLLHIGKNAFSDTGVKDIVLPESIKTLGACAFSSCEQLENVYIPKGLTDMPEDAFAYCSGLKEIKVAQQNPVYCSIDGCLVTINGGKIIKGVGGKIPTDKRAVTIGEYAYAVNAYGSTGLKHLEIPANIQSIIPGAFLGNIALESISVSPDSAYWYAEGNCLIVRAGKGDNIVFLGCKNSVIPQDGTITGIGAYAFARCRDIKSIFIPSSVDIIEPFAYYSCSYAQSIVISEGVECISDSAFEGCVRATSISVPSTVKHIGAKAFEGCFEITSINIPQGITEIHDETFYHCSKLKDVVIPQSCTKIGERAFACTNIKSINIPDSVKHMGEAVFIECTELESVTGMRGITAITKEMFSGCDKLDNFNIPSNITSIGELAFSYSRWIKTITIPDSVTEIGAGAFKYCEVLETVNIPSGVRIIKDSTFFATALKTLPLHENVTELGENAFGACQKLESASIPASVTKIGSCAFIRCTGLESLTLANGVAEIGSRAFLGCNKLKEVTIPASVKLIGDGALSACKALESVILDNSAAYVQNSNCLIEKVSGKLISTYGEYAIPTDGSVKSLGNYAFYEDGTVVDLVLPEGITSIGDFAFGRCANLNSVKLPSATEKIGKSAFSDCPVQKVFLPEDSAWVCIIEYLVGEESVQATRKVTADTPEDVATLFRNDSKAWERVS